MSRVQANITALRTLRDALPRFAEGQDEATSAANRWAASTVEALEGAELRQRQAVEIYTDALRECHWRAQEAAQQGYAWDCSSEAYSLQEAEERLSRIHAWQRRVEEAGEAYWATAAAYRQRLDAEVNQATRYLDGRIGALEAFLETDDPTTGATAGFSLASLDSAKVIKTSLSELRGESLEERFASGELRAEQLVDPNERSVAHGLLEAKAGLERNPHVADAAISAGLGDAVQNLAEIATDVATRMRENKR